MGNKYVTKKEKDDLINLIDAEIKTTEFLINHIEHKLKLIKISLSMIILIIILIIIIGLGG